MSSDQQLELTPTAVEGHGNTIAAWALVILVVTGLVVACVAFILASTAGTVTGLAIIVGGLVVSLILKAVGYGKLGSRTNGGH